MNINQTKIAITRHENSNESFSNSSMNFLFPSTAQCLSKNPNAYCNYASFLVICGYLCHFCVFPSLLFRMKQLSNRFKNQYSISFLWLCSILLVTCIDLLEFMLVWDNQIYSIYIMIIIIFYFFACLLTILRYMRFHSMKSTSFQNGLAVVFSICILFLVMFARIWSNRQFSKFPSIGKDSPWAFHLLNTYFFLYYFVYVMFASVQVISNAKYFI